MSPLYKGMCYGLNYFLIKYGLNYFVYHESRPNLQCLKDDWRELYDIQGHSIRLVVSFVGNVPENYNSFTLRASQ